MAGWGLGLPGCSRMALPTCTERTPGARTSPETQNPAFFSCTNDAQVEIYTTRDMGRREAPENIKTGLACTRGNEENAALWF